MSARAIEIIDAFGKDSGVFAFMNTAWGWPLIESLHFIGLALLLGTVGLFDLRVLQCIRGVAMSALHPLVKWGIVGFCINVATGAMFFVSAPDQYLYNPAFQLKALCMVIAGINLGAFYGTAMATELRNAPDAWRGTLALKLVAAVSLLAWLGVIAFGRLITFYRPPEHWCFWC